MGNIRSIVGALSYLGVESIVTDDPNKILKSNKLILPGVGSFSVAMKNLIEMGLVNALTIAVHEKKVPILGICLGMQLLAESGEEDGKIKGLGWISGSVQRFSFSDSSIRIPHTGFNTIHIKNENSTLVGKLDCYKDFYFTHSYHMNCDNEEDVSSIVKYNGNFVASVEKNNIFGTQFHPEKSQSNGLRLLKNFASSQLNYG